MQAKIRCKINASSRQDFGERMVCLSLETVDGTATNQFGSKLKCSLHGSLEVKEIIGNQLKIGSIIVLDVSVEEPNSV